MPKGIHKVTFGAKLIKLLPHPKKEYRAIAASVKRNKFAALFPDSDAKDILYASLISHTANHVNDNDCLITGEEAIASYKTLAEKPLDVEHETKEVVGFCVRSFLSNFKNSKILDEDQAWEINDNNGMFHVGGVFAIWKINHPEITDILAENFDQQSEYYDRVKASFEYYFDEYDYFVSDGSGDYPHGRIVASDDEEAKDWMKVLRIKGGAGKIEGKRLAIVPKGGFVGGCALTLNPANEFSDTLAMKDGKDVKVSEKVQSDLSTSVSNEREPMKPTETPIVAAATAPAEVVPTTPVEAAPVAAPVVEKVVAALPDVKVDKTVADALQVEMDKKIAELSEKENKLKEVDATVAKLQEDLKKTSEMAAALQTKLDKEIETRNLRETEEAARRKATLVTARMEALSKVFEVDEKTRPVLETEVAGLTDEAFNQKVSFYQKICAFKVEAAVPVATATPDVQATVQQAVAETVKATPVVDVVAASSSGSLEDAYRKAFGDPKSLGFKF